MKEEYKISAVSDILEFDKSISADLQKNRANLNIPLKALIDVLKIIKINKENLEFMCAPDSPSKKVEFALQLFGMAEKINKPFVLNDVQDKLFYFDPYNEKKQFYYSKIISNENLLNSPAIFLNGIDATVTNDLNSTGARLNILEQSFNFSSIGAYAYTGRRTNMADSLALILGDRDDYTLYHNHAAKHIFDYFQNEEGKEKGLTVFSLSNGVFYDRGVMNALTDIMKDKEIPESEQIEIVSKIRRVSFGVQPLWDAESKNELIEKYSPEINIVAANDIITPTAVYQRGLMAEIASDKERANNLNIGAGID